MELDLNLVKKIRAVFVGNIRSSEIKCRRQVEFYTFC